MNVNHWVQQGSHTTADFCWDFRRYVVNENYRNTVYSLVQDQETQIWSDLTELDLAGQRALEDISAVARLNNLRGFSLTNTQVKNVTVLAGLRNLRIFR